MASRIRKGDTVEIRAGKNKGKRGIVLSVDPRRKRVVVETVNLAKRHTRPSAQHRQGGIIEKEQPVHLSNVSVVHKGEPTRVGLREVNGEKVRWSKKHDEAIGG